MGVYIITFVFWVGIAHAGTLISAILFLFRSQWRKAINRTAEAMTVFAVMTAGLFPSSTSAACGSSTGCCRIPNQRYLWLNFKTPLVWDVFAISTYLTVSTIFLYVGMVPDIAVVRDQVNRLAQEALRGAARSAGPAATASGALHAALPLPRALATPLVLSVHTVVSWDFAMSIVPGWHATIFAPYFVAGAIFSGIAMVLTLMIPLRQAASASSTSSPTTTSTTWPS